jgi:outer membrane protein OmpA-like peptidoglycan-associated protein
LDGVPDEKDKCPLIIGASSLDGCPDKDGDGIPDYLDKCPETSGAISLKGCPDKDADGVMDSEDYCPDLKGFTALHGCPDVDGDGILENIDKCPKVAGIESLEGCPEIKADLKKTLQKASLGIQFEPGKAVLQKQSLEALNQVATLLELNTDYRLLIGGHTDNVGDPATNLELSENRARAVQMYLLSKGIDSARLYFSGYGDTKPIADNATKEGRIKNRRIELSIFF